MAEIIDLAGYRAEKRRKFMMKVFGTDNVHEIYERDANAAGNYLFDFLLPYICDGTKEESELAENVIDLVDALDGDEEEDMGHDRHLWL